MTTTTESLDDSRPPATQETDRVLTFLPLFEDRSRRWYEVHKATTDEAAPIVDVADGKYLYDETVHDFIAALQDGRFFMPFDFDWGEWQPIAERYVKEPKLLGEASMTTLRKLFTTGIRKEPFSTGHLARLIDGGHIVELLRRLKTLRASMPAA